MSIRDNLGDFCSIVCFKHVITGVEDVLGVDGAGTVLIRAGVMRGQGVAEEAKLAGTNPPVETMAATLDKFLGKDGTCLCEVSEVRPHGDGYVVTTKETVCSAGEAPGSERVCSYTLGAVQGFLEAITGKKFIGRHTESVLRGGSADVFTFSPL
jgi:predicted hydrocarbon binding protein